MINNEFSNVTKNQVPVKSKLKIHFLMFSNKILYAIYYNLQFTESSSHTCYVLLA